MNKIPDPFSLALTCFFLTAPWSLHLLAAETTSATELLDRYAETRGKFKSFIIKHEDTYEGKSVFTMPQYRHLNGKSNRHETSEYRYDGNRYYNSMHRTSWTRQGKNGPYYNTSLYDGKHNYYRSQMYDGTKPDRIVINLKPSGIDPFNAIQQYVGLPLLGILRGDKQPIDEVLRGADNISLRDKMERTGESNCYVIDATTKSGKYTVWIDIEHGYNIAKARVRKSGKDLYNGQPVSEMAINKLANVRYRSIDFSIEDIHFKKIGDAWVPMDGVIRSVTKFSNGDSTTNRHHHKRTEVILNPDHDAMGSFVPRFPNGSTVSIVGMRGVNYTWKDGGYLTKANKEQLDSFVQEMTQNKTDAEGTGRASSKPSAQSAPGGQKANQPKHPTSQAESTAKQAKPGDVSDWMPRRHTLLTIFILIWLIAGLTGVVWHHRNAT